ncbi:hypothetical protein WJX73_003409 [Symbiochloris irregularis]|uniref:DNA 3'-5' helicase n=1 Tax=Symbiochloris irregularis TaxID=706552 RepID=A0AAW1PD97_9CHLO
MQTYVPALPGSARQHHQQAGEDYGVRSVEELPEAFRGLFNFRFFNIVQSESFDRCFADGNMVVSAPTGSGKTGILELAMIRLFAQAHTRNGSFAPSPGAVKALYLAPNRALVQERVKDWQGRFRHMSLECKELTGDTGMLDVHELDNADIICTTPEKFDAVTRKRQDQGGMRFLGEVGLLPIARVRFIAISATVPNIQDLGSWLEVPSGGVMVFGDELRPVKLRTVVKGYAPTKTDFLFEKRLNDYLLGVIQEHSQQKPTLVFCSSRKGVADTALHIAKDRAAVEDLFRSRMLAVLCTTSTLAMGVNLPAHLVIIKGTRLWAGAQEDGASKGFKEYDRSACLQMIGRAGRPQFDNEGVAVIMTASNNVRRYNTLALGQELLESQLQGPMAEHLNAEIVLRTVTDVSQAIMWVCSTFMYIRVKQNPSFYGMPANLHTARSIEGALKDRVIMSTLRDLAQHGLVEMDDQAFSFTSTEPGRLMAHHYIRLKTMIAITALDSHASMPDLLMLIARSTECSSIKIKRGEKKQLNQINKQLGHDRLEYCILDDHRSDRPKERLGSGPEKSFVMVNATLSNESTEGFDQSMKQDLDQVIRDGKRITSCMVRYFAWSRQLAAAANALILQKCLQKRMWPQSDRLLSQMARVGRQLATKLHAAGIDSLAALNAADPRRLESAAQRAYPFGTQLKDDLKHILPPAVSLEIECTGVKAAGMATIKVTLTRMPASAPFPSRSAAHLVAGSTHDDKLLLHEALLLEQFPSPFSWQCDCSVQAGTGSIGVPVVASLILDDLLGLDVHAKLMLPSSGTFAAQQSQEAGPGRAEKCGTCHAKQVHFARHVSKAGELWPCDPSHC